MKFLWRHPCGDYKDFLTYPLCERGIATAATAAAEKWTAASLTSATCVAVLVFCAACYAPSSLRLRCCCHVCWPAQFVLSSAAFVAFLHKLFFFFWFCGNKRKPHFILSCCLELLISIYFYFLLYFLSVFIVRLVRALAWHLPFLAFLLLLFGSRFTY